MVLEQEVRQVETALFQLASTLAQLKKLVDSLGGHKDTVDHRSRLAATNLDMQALAKELKVEISTLHEEAAAGGHVAVQQKTKKLLQDFAALLQDYKATQNVAISKEAASLPRSSRKGALNTTASSSGGRGSPALGLSLTQLVALEEGEAQSHYHNHHTSSGRGVDAGIEHEKLLQMQAHKQSAAVENEVAFNTALIEERDMGLAEIQRQIGEVNEMFQDLAVLISDQGEQVHSMDEHIVATAENVNEGRKQLAVAERSQLAARNRWIWIWVVLALIVSAVIIIISS